jgi:hypothetical protein
MDTSETYIKMCKKAVEIQEVWNRNIGDWYVDSFLNNIKQKDDWNIYILWYDEPFLYQSRFKWIPRQDQLQDFFSPVTPNIFRDIFNFSNALKYSLVYEENRQLFYSMEQLWLAFVMKEKFNKVWDGNDWIDHEIQTRR